MFLERLKNIVIKDVKMLNCMDCKNHLGLINMLIIEIFLYFINSYFENIIFN
jgi:hypothetical protein